MERKRDHALRHGIKELYSKRIEEIESADILVGIPCYNNEKTVAHVIQMVTHGLAKHYNGKSSVIFIADGGSTDDTREVVREFEIKPWQEKIVSIYRGPGGKGTALRSLFDAAVRLKVRVCAMVDSDLRSITADWVKYLLDPVLERDYQFVAPVYVRHKYDGTITKFGMRDPKKRQGPRDNMCKNKEKLSWPIFIRRES